MTMYSRITSLIMNNMQTSAGFAKRLITCLLYARRQLAPREVEEALIVGSAGQVKSGQRFNHVMDMI